MDDETESPVEEQVPESGPPVVLGYQTPRRSSRAIASPPYMFCGVIATILGIVMLLLAIGFLSVVVTLRGALFDEDRIRTAAIDVLLIFGVGAAVRSAWYYFGGWAETPDHGKRARKIVLPWNWY